MNWKEFTEKHNLLQPGLEPGYRNEFLNSVVVDVVQRGSDYNVIIYVMPGEPPSRVEPAIKKSCIDIFGHRLPEGIETVFYPKGLGLEVGADRGQFDSFCIVLKHPLTLKHTLDSLKVEFTTRLWEHL